jgi:hypothetical protein
MSLPWFRLYSEFAGDPLIQSLAFEDQRHFVVLLCLKCDGVLDRPMQGTTRERIICRGLGLDPMTASEAKRRLMEVGLIDKNWQPSAWDKRQFVSDVSTERTRKYRKNKKAGNVTEASPLRSGNAPDTDTDTDKGFPVAREEKVSSTGVNSSRFGQWTGQHHSARMASPEEEVF